MVFTAISGTPKGVEAELVRVEVALTNSLQSMEIVGLPEGAVREGKVRVQSALNHLGYQMPQKKVTVNLGPADLRKDGSAFDLPIALCMVGVITKKEPGDFRLLQQHMMVGELTLDGRVRAVRGVLPSALAACRAGLKGLVVPRDCQAEASAVPGLELHAVDTLAEAIALVYGEAPPRPREEQRDQWEREPASGSEGSAVADVVPDMSDVKGQAMARRALEVAAAGGHNLLFIGPPGSGKSMLARRLTSILPDLADQESLEVSSIYSVGGLLRPGQGLITRRPFRAPHHTITQPALVGGGHGIARPGELSLAHLGVLFLDELPEFRPAVLETLRQPLENGWISVGRARGTICFPGQITLVAAMNPCPCGQYGSLRGRCRCNPAQIQGYKGRISGPLLDRIDLHIHVPEVPWIDISNSRKGEDSATIRGRVVAARTVQRERLSRHALDCNARMPSSLLREHCKLTGPALSLLKHAMGALGLSARAHDRILKVARTVADLDGCTQIAVEHLAEAIQYRSLDKQNQEDLS